MATPVSLLQPTTSTLDTAGSATKLDHLSQEERDALRAAVFQRLHPRAYLERYIAEDVRPDGRSFLEFRDVFVNVGSISTADGSALVKIGHTTVVCGVKAELAEPELDRGKEGFLVPNVDLPAMCSPKFKPGPPTEEAQVLSERLNEILAISNFLPLATLCIEPGKSAWVLYVDATCINYDGNAFDATLLAMTAALRNTTLPKAVYNPDTNQTLCYRTPRSPLQLSSSVPLSMTFGIFDSKLIFADPTAFEEPLLDTTITIVVGDENQIVSLSQLGSALLTVDDGEKDALSDCIAIAKKQREELIRTLPR